MRKTRLVTATALVVGALAGFAGPADAGTSTTFAISSGSLALTAPSSASLGSGSPGSTVSGSLGSVSVDDARASLTGAWTATVVSSAFTTGGATTAETIPASAVRYWSGPTVTTTGLGVFLPGQATAELAVAISTAQTAFSRAASVGNSTASWSPTVIVTVPADAVAGEYVGTITHSLA
jgi:hypothetical protein